MYARTTTIHAAKDRIEAGVREFREIVAEFHGLDGFMGAEFMVDRRLGRVVATTFWETEAAMLDSERRADERRALAAEVMGSTVSPSVERFQVLHSEMRQPTAS